MDSTTTPEIDEIWQADKLGRKQEAQHLLRFLENKYQAETNTPFVLNIDSSWGHGKTFFINRLATQLKHHNYPVVVFDAWQNDFSDEALLSFISAVCNALDIELNGKKARDEVKKLRSFATSLIKPALPVLFSAIVKQLTGMSLNQVVSQNDGEGENPSKISAEDVADLSAKFSQLAASRALEQYTEKKNATEGFIQTIENLVSIVEKGRSKKKQLPIFIFVDELDRCRPTFSIELLESIKHLFSAPGVYFIVSTDTKQLCHSIKAVYGADFDAKRYLKRFFDLEYQLDTPKTHQLAVYLFEKFNSKDKLYIPEKIRSNLSLEACFGDVCDFFRLGARDIEQVFEILKTSTYLAEGQLHFFYLMLMACMQHKYPEYDLLQADDFGKNTLNDFFSQKVAEREIENSSLEYPDNSSGGKSVKISLRNIFNLYNQISNADLLSENYLSKQSAIGRDIARRLISDNGFVRNGAFDDRKFYDKTLANYSSLVRKAGKFHQELTSLG